MELCLRPNVDRLIPLDSILKGNQHASACIKPAIKPVHQFGRTIVVRTPISCVFRAFARLRAALAGAVGVAI
jgi:hypothetical protein